MFFSCYFLLRNNIVRPFNAFDNEIMVKVLAERKKKKITLPKPPKKGEHKCHKFTK
jgi:hypothetical protein